MHPDTLPALPPGFPDPATAPPRADAWWWEIYGPDGNGDPLRPLEADDE